MEKKLFTIGNSVALLIDKPLRRARARLLHMRRYEQWTLYVRWETLTDAERRAVRRFAILHAALKAGQVHDEAIETARKAEPFDPDDPDERDAGNERRDRAPALA